MRYILGFVKVMVLAVLIVASIYQTGELWFGDTSDRSFFYDVIKKASGPAEALVIMEDDIIVPEQLGIFLDAPDIEYTVIGYGAAMFDSIVEASTNVLKTVLEEGSYIGTLDTEEDIWEEQHLILILPFDYSGNNLSEGFGLSPVKTENLASVASVIIVPAGEDQLSLHMYIESGIDNQVFHYVIDRETVQIDDEVLSNSLSKVVERDNNAAYRSTRKNHLPGYGRTLLLPLVSRNIRYHSSIYWEIPFVDEGTFDQDGVRQLIRPFFDNPDVIGEIAFDDELRFTLGKISVKYNNEGILEYTNNSETQGVPELVEAVALSQQFLKKWEKNTSFEYHLVDYAEGSEDMTIYYNVGYNGFPIVMSEAEHDVFGMPYSVAVTVRGSEVVHYKSILREIPELMPQFEIFDTPYEDALDSLIAEVGPLTSPITNMYLGYKWVQEASEMNLHWIVEVDDQVYFHEVGGR